MSTRRSTPSSTSGRRVLLGVALLLIAAGPSLANTAVNTYTTSDQNAPSIAVDGQGRFIITWVSDGQDGDGLGIFGQRFDANGTALGNEFAVNTYTTGDQVEPHVAANAGGDFIVVWRGHAGTDRFDVRGRRFNAAGAPVGTEFQVSEDTSYDRRDPAVALAEDGSFMALWTGTLGTETRHFDHNTAPTTGDFQLASTPHPVYGPFHSLHDAAVSGDGDFILNWHTYSVLFAGDFRVAGYMYDPDTGQGTSFGPSPGDEADIEPSLALTPDGGFVIAWNRFGYGGVNPGSTFANRYASNGTLQGEFLSHVPSIQSTQIEDIAAAGADRFLVVWDEPAVRGRFLDLEGAPLTDPFTISSGPVDANDEVVVASFGRRTMVAWTENQGAPAQREVVAATRFALFSDGFEGGNTASWSAAVSPF